MDITVQELNQRITEGTAPVMIDVRNPDEWERQALPQAKRISLHTIPSSIGDIENLKDQEVVVICRSGGRSGQAKMFLAQKGFSNVRNLEGGMLAWKAHIDPTFDVD